METDFVWRFTAKRQWKSEWPFHESSGREGRIAGRKTLSEYQYYEFQAIDRPLGEADREALRALSTRARITATSFTNHYEWGDFKGDPRRLMERLVRPASLSRELGNAPA